MGACPKGLLLRWVGAAVGALPAAWVPRLGGWLSRIGPLTRRRARIAGRNLELAFPGLGPEARERLLRATLASNTTGALDTLRTWFAPSYRLRRSRPSITPTPRPSSATWASGSPTDR